MYYILYKTTCNKNGNIYIGAHSCNNLEDGYLGSGKLIKCALKKYGKENFTREILEFCDSELDMYLKEAELVTAEFVKLITNYNLFPGGMKGYSSVNTIPVIDEAGNCFRIPRDDPKWISGELKHNMSGLIIVQDDSGKLLVIRNNDPRWISKELKSINKNKVLVFHKEINSFKMIDKLSFNHDFHVYGGSFISTENAKARAEKGNIKKRKREKTKGELYALEQFKKSNVGKMNVVDKDGNISKVNIDDQRVNVTLFHIRKGQKLSESSLIKQEKYEYVLKSPEGEIVHTHRMKDFARSHGFTGLFKVGCKRKGWELLEKRSLSSSSIYPIGNK